MRLAAWLLAALVVAAPAAAADTSKADALFAKRADPKMLEAAVEAYEAAGAHVMAARGAFLRIDLHDDLAEDEDATGEWIERGLRAAAKALGVAADQVPKSLGRLRKKDAEALYWFAALYGRKVELASIFRRAGMAKTFLALTRRAAELDGTVYYGGPHRMLGNFYARAPGFMGGDDEKAREELDRAVSIAPDFFLNRRLRAERIHAPRGDREAFRADLEKIVEAPEDVLPAVVPEQRAVKQDAKKLLGREAELF